MMLTTVLVGVLVLISDFFIRSTFFSRRDDRGGINIIMIGVALSLAILSPIIGEAMKMAVSRKREYLADANGVFLSRNPNGLANALKKISSDKEPSIPNVNRATAHLWIENPLRGTKGFLNNIFSTHPPIHERIKRLESM